MIRFCLAIADPKTRPEIHSTKTISNASHAFTPRMAQNKVYELIVGSYPCRVVGDKLYQSNIFSGYERFVIESRNSEGERVNSKAPASVDTS